MQQLDVELLFPASSSSPGAPAPSSPSESAFQRRRGRVRRAELIIEQAALNRTLAAVIAKLRGSGPGTLPFDLVRVRIDGSSSSPGFLVLFRMPPPSGPASETDRRPGPGPLWGTARIAARRPPAGAYDLVLGLSEVRLYGRHSVSSALVGHTLLQALGLALLAYAPTELPPVTLNSGATPIGIHLLNTPALTELRVEALHDALLDVLPRAGYRAADPSTAPLFEIQALPGQLVLRYAADGQRGGLSYADLDDRPRSNPAIEPSALLLGAPLPEPLRIGDHLLYHGDPPAALSAYRLVATSQPLAALARARCLQILSVVPERRTAALELADAELVFFPSNPGALIALAGMAEDSGEPEAAARRYLALGADMGSHPVERAAAFYAASRCLNRSDPAAAQSARSAAETLLTAGGPEDPLLEAVQAAVQEAQRPVGPPPSPVSAAARVALREQTAAASPPERIRLLDEALAKAPADPELVRLRAEQEEPAAALARIEAALGIPPRGTGPATAEPPPAASDDETRRLILYGAQLAQGLGEIPRGRILLGLAGLHPDALRARVQLDWPELLQADPGSPSDLLPVLVQLHKSGQARPEELRGLARLLTMRGKYAEALAVQEQAGADPDELLASLEAAGRSRELLQALSVHAKQRPDTACLLYQQAANVAEHQLGDRPRAASYWQLAAELASQETRLDDAALFWFHAGRLWQEHGDSNRAYAAMGRAVELGGGGLPRLTPLLAELAYTLGDLEAAALYYRRSLDGGQIPPQARAEAYLRIAESARAQGDVTMEEQALTRAVEAGGGSEAWPRLAAIFRTLGEHDRLAAALVAAADHESPEKKIELLREAATFAQPPLLSRIDGELVALDGDNEAVRDRLLDRLTEQVRLHPSDRGEQRELLEALRRDVRRSEGDRRRERARGLVELGLKLSIYSAGVEGFAAILDESRGQLDDETLQWALDFWNTLLRARAGLHVPPEALDGLRAQIIDIGDLPTRWAALESELESLTASGEEGRRDGQLILLGRVAGMADLLGYDDHAARRYLELSALLPRDREVLSRLRRVLLRLAQSGRAEEAVALVESELRRQGAAAVEAVGLRVALAELLMFLGRPADALGELEAVLGRIGNFGPAHALLGMLLGTSTDSEEVGRSLQHLLVAAYAPDIEAAEAGECALMAADMLASSGLNEPVEVSALLAASARSGGYAERHVVGTFVAVPTDFLDAEGAAAPIEEESAKTPPALPPLIGPAELLLHAAALLPGDPRPLEGLLGLTWSHGDYTQAVECCDRLLALPQVASDPVERARISVEKAHVLLRLGNAAEAEALLRQSLAAVPGSPAALRALRRLLLDRGELGEALALLERELKLAAIDEPGSESQAVLYVELGQVQSRLGQTGSALDAFRRAGHLGLGTGWLRLADGLAEQGDWLGAADAAGRGAVLTPESERPPLLLRAAELALRADDDLRARDYLLQAVILGGETGAVAEERLRELDGGPEPEKRRRTLERRLKHTAPGIERLELLRRLLLLCCELYERTAMVSYANALLREAPGDSIALCALAEDAIEHGQPEVAAGRITQAGAIPPGYPRATRLLACLGEVQERKGNTGAAEAAYQRLLEAGERLGDLPAVELAIEGLARLREEAGDAGGALRWLRRRLPYLPPDAVTARATLRLRLADLAMGLADLDEARQQLLEVLAESPAQRSALVKLLDVCRQLGDTGEALRILDRLLDLTMTPGERAEWLFARAELCEKQLGSIEEAERLYRQVLTQWPAHARALRRLIVLAAGRADRAAVVAAVKALTKAGAPLAEAQIPAGLALLLPAAPGDEEPVAAQPRSALGIVQPLEDPQALLRAASPAELAAGLLLVAPAAAKDMRLLDGPIAGALRALDGNTAPLVAALRTRIEGAGFDPGAARVLARLHEGRGGAAGSLYLAALAFLDPKGAADEKLDELGALPVSEVALEAALLAVRPMPAEQAPWLVVFGLLGRHVLGLPAPPLPAGATRSSEWETSLGELGRMLGFDGIQVVLGDGGGGEQALAEPTRPPRLRLSRSLVTDAAETRFAALRALHLLRAGVPLCERGGPEETGALVRAAAALWLEGMPGVPHVGQDGEDGAGEPLHPREREWVATLRELGLHPEQAPGVVYEARAEAESVQRCLRQLAEQPGRLAELWPALLATARLEASARALGQLGDLRAALRALYRQPPLADATAERERRLQALRSGPLGDLLAIAARIYE